MLEKITAGLLKCDIFIMNLQKDESIQNLRNLELEAYSHLVSALRAQGPLNSDKRKLLKETSNALNISQERHKAEVRRALSDEKLRTIAYHLNSQNEYADDWSQEGRRVIPLMPRMAPQTAYSAIADEVAENADQNNKLLPPPANTERKRSAIIQSNQMIPSESSKPNSFRIPDAPKHDENKKRKIPESSLAQHLLGPSKITKIQQIYRQKTKSKTKEQFTKVKSELEQQELLQNQGHSLAIQKPAPIVKIPMSTPITTVSSNGSKINVLQNINLQQSFSTISEDQTDSDLNHYVVQKLNEQNHITSQSTNMSENLTNRLKFLTKSNNNVMFKSLATSGGTNLNVDLQKTSKMCPSKKTTTKNVPTAGQKLIVVSNAQTISSSSILQRTLTIPFVKNIAMKNFDKFKIVTTTATPITLATSMVGTNSFNSVKHKVVTVRTNNSSNTGKKVFPLTQLQMLNKGSIKVLPLGGKIVGKASTSTTPSSMYFMNTMGDMQTLTKSINNLPLVTARKASENIDEAQVTLPHDMELIGPNFAKNNEKLKNLKNSPTKFGKSNMAPIVEDYDAKIDEFHIQTVPITSQDTVVEVQCENEVGTEELIQTIEAEKSEIFDVPEIDCFISEAIDISEKVLNVDNSLEISPEIIEVEVKNENNLQLDSLETKEEMTDVEFLEN